MTMLDDDRLSSLLGSAAAAFEPPAGGPDVILARAQTATVGARGQDVDDDHREQVEDRGDAATEDGAATPPDVSADPRRRAHGTRTVAEAARRHRVLAVAACVVVAFLVAAGIGALVAGPSARPRQTAASAPGNARHLTGTPNMTTTTLPAQGLTSKGAAATPAHNGSLSAGAAVPGTYGANQSAGASTAPALPKGSVGQSAKIEQTGTLGLMVGRGDLSRTVTQLGALAGAAGGFVANSQSQSGAGSGGPPSGTVTLEVPVDSFSSVLKQAQRLGTTTSLTSKATDVTGQYVDLQSRITALQDSRQQYLTIMTKATTVGDVLAVQTQLDTIESQIEQLQGQLQVLGSETSYSSWTVNVSEATAPSRPSPLPESGMVRAWHDSIGGFVTGVEGIVTVAGPLLFALVCFGVVLFGGRALWRRYQRHRL